MDFDGKTHRGRVFSPKKAPWCLAWWMPYSSGLRWGCGFAGEIQAQGDRHPHSPDKGLELRPRASLLRMA